MNNIDNKALFLACKFIYEVSGTCPWDQFDTQPVDCKEECTDDIAINCFMEHFRKEAAGGLIK